MSFTFSDKKRERPEWMPPAGHYLLGVYALGETTRDYGKGPEEKAEWCFVVLAGPEKGKRIIDVTGFSFFAGNGTNMSPATAYKWVKTLRFKNGPVPADYEPVSDDIVGRIAYGTCFETAKGYLRVSTDLLPVTELPDGLTVDDINATMEQARVDHAATEAARASNGSTNGAHASATTVDDMSMVPF